MRRFKSAPAPWSSSSEREGRGGDMAPILRGEHDRALIRPPDLAVGPWRCQ